MNVIWSKLGWKAITCACVHCVLQTSNNNGHILDLVITSDPNIISGIEAHSPATVNFPSDHHILDFCWNVRLRRLKIPRRFVYNFKHVDFNVLRNEIRQSELLASSPDLDNSDNAWHRWKKSLLDIVNNHVPKTKARDSDSPPWIDSDVKHLLKKKETARRRAASSHNTSDRAKYVELPRASKRLIETKHREYMETLGQSIQDNPKRFWGHFRAMSKTNYSAQA